MKERREWKRIMVDILAKCRLEDEAVYHHIRITDMHHQGCRFVSDAGFATGQNVRIVVDESVLGKLYLVGAVLWVSRIEGGGLYQVGIKFLINDPVAVENSSRLYKFLMTR